jgi:hypothetical protein
MEKQFLLMPQSKFDELQKALSDIQSLLKDIKYNPKPFADWMPETELAKLLGLRRTSLWYLRKSKKVVFSKIGSKIFYSRQSVENLTAKNSVKQ